MKKTMHRFITLLFVFFLFFGISYAAGADKDANIEIVDKNAKGAIAITADYINVIIRINGEYIGKTPLFVKISNSCIKGKDLIIEADPVKTMWESAPCLQKKTYNCADAIPKEISFQMYSECRRADVSRGSLKDIFERLRKEASLDSPYKKKDELNYGTLY